MTSSTRTPQANHPFSSVSCPPSFTNHYATRVSYTFSFNCPATILTSHVVVLHFDAKFSPLLDVVWCSPQLWLHSAVWSNSQVRLPAPIACRGLVDLVTLFKRENYHPVPVGHMPLEWKGLYPCSTIHINYYDIRLKLRLKLTKVTSYFM